MTAKKFRDWEIFFELEPFGDIRDDYRTASIVQMIYNVRAKTQRPLKDFVLNFGAQAPKKQTWQEQARMLTLFAQIHNMEQLAKK